MNNRFDINKIAIIKKNGTREHFDPEKIVIATQKSANRIAKTWTENEKEEIKRYVTLKIKESGETEFYIDAVHSMVEYALEKVNSKVANQYRNYRNWKQKGLQIFDEMEQAENTIRYIGDRSNANKDAKLVATKRSLLYGEYSTKRYEQFFLNEEEKQAAKDGFIYIHDKDSRLDSFNCFRRDTKFITKNGINSFYDFNDGDTTIVLSHKGIWRKATVHKLGWQEIQKVTLKKRVPTSQEKEIYCTKNHKWFLKDEKVTTELKVTDILYSIPDKTNFEWDSLNIEEKRLWCKGFAMSDGWVSKGKLRPDYVAIRLCLEKIKYAERFHDAGYTTTQPDSYNGDYLVSMFNETSKDIPWLDLNYLNVLYFVNGLMCADGHKNTMEKPSSEFKGIQVSGELNQFIYDLLNMAGYYVTSTDDLTGEKTNSAIRKKQTVKYQLSSSQNGLSAWRVQKIEQASLNPRAEVWCLDVEEDHGFILEGGIPTGNCCLFDMEHVLQNGFQMGNMWYNEPNSLDTAFDVMGDVILSTAAQQYGGFTVPEVDNALLPYAQKSYDAFYQEKYNEVYALQMEMIGSLSESQSENLITNEMEKWLESMKIKAKTKAEIKAKEFAFRKIQRECDQGMQGIEYKLNTVGSSRGDYPFTTMTLGLAEGELGKMITKSILKVRKEGQGKKGFKKPVLFPKLVFLYDKEKHGAGKEYEDVFNCALECSGNTMYPDYLSLTGAGYVPSIYKKYGAVISPMGCRAFLSPWYERGGMDPADENDVPVFVGRFNLGVVTLHLPMILMKSKKEKKDFYEVLDYYMDLIRNFHKRTIDYLGNLRAGCNPMCFCEGGLYGGNLKPDDKIAPLLKPCTLSFGVTALNELQVLYNGKSIREDGEFALETMNHINKLLEQYKKEDNILWAIYGTPAETLCFAGETDVQTYGGIKQIKDITTKDLVYSYNEADHKIELKKVVNSQKTRENAIVVKVTFDNGQNLICTPNHEFAVRTLPERDGSGRFSSGESIKYIMAQNLKEGDKVKSNYIHINSHGRPECSIYNLDQKQLIQDINAEYYLEKKPDGYVTHHRDENKKNNEFTNLEYMYDAEHRRYHLKDTAKKFSYTTDCQKGSKNSFYGKHHTHMTKELNRLKHIGKSIERFDLLYQSIAHFDCADDAEKAGFTRNLVKQACEGVRNTESGKHYYKDSYWYYSEDCLDLIEKNHKVISVEYQSENRDVYDIEVEDNHNFFVGGYHGILVHNCGKQIEQFRAKYGVVEGISSREYTTNSFHDPVWEDITPIEKQNDENRFWSSFNGGKIQYCKYPVKYNLGAIKTLVRRAMDMGLYEGVNLSLSYCNHCGHEELNMKICTHCGSKNITAIDRMNGYLGFTRVGTTDGDFDFDSTPEKTGRFNKSKTIEISERKSM